MKIGTQLRSTTAAVACGSTSALCACTGAAAAANWGTEIGPKGLLALHIGSYGQPNISKKNRVGHLEKKLKREGGRQLPCSTHFRTANDALFVLEQIRRSWIWRHQEVGYIPVINLCTGFWCQSLIAGAYYQFENKFTAPQLWIVQYFICGSPGKRWR
jgi:hypothetical protein